jgi:hypothetical protein
LTRFSDSFVSLPRGSRAVDWDVQVSIVLIGRGCSGAAQMLALHSNRVLPARTWHSRETAL